MDSASFLVLKSLLTNETFFASRVITGPSGFVRNHRRRRLAHLKLRTYLLDLRRLLFDLRRESLRFLLLPCNDRLEVLLLPINRCLLLGNCCLQLGDLAILRFVEDGLAVCTSGNRY